MDMIGSPITVMIVDDQATVRKGIKAFLAEYDNICVIAEVADGLQAIAILEKIKPDIVILDLLMPGIDGIETIERMLAKQQDQHIILLTADYRDTQKLLAIQAGASDYVRKDANPTDLIDAIQKVYETELGWMRQKVLGTPLAIPHDANPTSTPTM